jgi:Carbamoyltransferase C-terminus
MAKLLADQRVIGWFQGASEFGPRALGNRGLLADPRKAKMKDISEQADQTPAGISAIRADRTCWAGKGDLRGRGGFAVHLDRQARPTGVAGPDSSRRLCRRNRAGSNRC